MPGRENFTSLEALPPSVGDAEVAAVLLRDLAAAMTDRHGGIRAAAVEVDETGRFALRPLKVTGTPIDGEHAPLAAPELFDGAEPDARTDVYAAACLALTRYLGGSPLPVPPLARRAPTAVRIGALRQAHRTLPPRLGAVPAPFRAAFAQAVAKQAHLRPTPESLVAMLDAAFVAAGAEVETAARARVRRLVQLARVFVPVGAAAVPLAKSAPAPAAGAPLHLPLRTLPAFARPSGVARVALIAAVAVVATGGVAVAAVVGLRGGTPETPQAVSSREATPTASASVEPVAATTSAAVSSSAPPATSIAPPPATPTPAAPAPAAGSGGGSNNGGGSNSGAGGGSNGGNSNGGGSNSGSGNGGGSNGGGSNGGGSNGGGSNGGGGNSAPPASTPPRATSKPPSPPPVVSSPPTTPVDTSTPTPPRGSPTGSSPSVEASSSAAPASSDQVPPASQDATDSVPPASEVG